MPSIHLGVASSIHNPANVMHVDAPLDKAPATTLVDMVEPSVPTISDPLLVAILAKMESLAAHVVEVSNQNQCLADCVEAFVGGTHTQLAEAHLPHLPPNQAVKANQPSTSPQATSTSVVSPVECDQTALPKAVDSTPPSMAEVVKSTSSPVQTQVRKKGGKPQVPVPAKGESFLALPTHPKVGVVPTPPQWELLPYHTVLTDRPATQVLIFKLRFL